MKLYFKCLGVVFAVSALLSCAREADTITADAPNAPASPAQVSPPPPSAPVTAEGPRKRSEAQGQTTAIIRGSGKFMGGSLRRVHSLSASPDGEVTLDFTNADIRDVVKAVLGDLLKVNYTIDGKVHGEVTIQTNKALQRNSILPVFEQALKMSGMALVRTGDMYQVVLASDAPRQQGMVVNDGRQSGQPGYGVEIVPLQYIGAADMKKLLEPLAPPGGILQADTTRNLIILAGTQQERALMLDDIAMFDADWLSGMSFAFYFPKFVNVKQLAKELEQVIGGRESPIKGVIQFVPLERLNALLAISPQSRYVEELQPWVDRLDHPGEGPDQRLYVYRVQNGRAADLAAVLTKSLEQNGSQSSRTGAARADEQATGRRAAMPVEGAAGNERTDATSRTATSHTSGADGIQVGGLANINITADEVNNSLVILASPREYAAIESALTQLDAVPMQVFLEAAVAEVTLTSELKYGVQYFLQNHSGTHQAVLSQTATSAITAPLPGFAYTFAPGTDIKIILNALDSVTAVNVVSAPQVLVLNNQTASLQVGDQVPIATQQAVSTLTPGAPVVNSIQFRDTGVILKVTPRVNQGGMVMMDVSQEVSDVSPTTTSTLNSPTIQQRKLNSTVAMRDGETIAMGGLIKDGTTNGKDGIPILSNIPYLGSLFGAKDDKRTRTELLVLITPHVVDSTQKARSVTDELRHKLPLTLPLLRMTR